VIAFSVALIALADAAHPEDFGDIGQILLRAAVIFVLVALNGFFVAAEFALVKIRVSQLDALIEEGDRRARAARHILDHLDAYLSACQLGITLASLILGALGEPYLAAVLTPLLYKFGLTNPGVIHAISFGIAIATITAFHITLGEQVPKIMAIRKATATTLFIARPLGWFCAILKPAIIFLNAVSNWMLKRLFRIEPASEHELAHSEEELRHIFAESARAQEVTPLGKELLTNALDLRDRVVRDTATPRGEVIFLNTEDSFDENLKRAMESRHTRFPLCRGHLDDTIGLVHIKDLLKLVHKPGPGIESIKRELHSVPEMMPLEKLLSFFLARHAHLALVVDEFGGAAGIVTLDNVIEELVGDIQDEFDTEKPELQKVTADEFNIAGTLGLYELNEMLGLDIESDDVSTVGGYITQILGHLPRGGEKARIEDYEVVVTKADGRRVQELHFKRVGK
jgi:CBS domain containing-hemolysin-like protein